MYTKKKHIEWEKLFEMFLIFLFLPTIMAYLVARWPWTIKSGYFFIITLFLIQSILSYVYSFAALRRKKFEPKHNSKLKPPPKTTFIVSAYLPNEVSVIEKTLLHILKEVEQPAKGIEVILAYNTPSMEKTEKPDPKREYKYYYTDWGEKLNSGYKEHVEGIETRLKDMALMYPELILSNTFESRSKSENLNYALEIASGDMLILLDADHLVDKDCIRKAWRWLDEGYDCVQGRCKIRNGGENLLTRLIEVEFEVIYGIAHPAKSLVFDSSLFGGSNGYWKAEVLKEIRFNSGMLTEDIDASIRTTLSGKKIVHDRSIISSELAPVTLGSWWFQRKRWAQGWFQVSVKYQKRILLSDKLNASQKFLWTTLLLWRVFYDIFSHFLFPIVFGWWIYIQGVSLPVNTYIALTIVMTLTCGPFEGFAAYKNASHPRASIFRYFLYALFTFPYTLLKNTIQVIAIRDELLGKKEWIISER